MRFQVHGNGVGIEIGLVVLRIEADQHVAHDERAEKVLDRDEEALVQVVAHLFEAEDVGLTCCAAIFSSTWNPLLRAAPTAIAARLLLWQETQAALGTKSASACCSRGRLPWMALWMRVVAPRLQDRRHRVRCAFAPDFTRNSTIGVSPWSLAMSSTVRPESPLCLWVSLRVDVGAALDQQLDHVQRQQVGGGGVHQRRAAERIEGVDVGAVVEHDCGRRCASPKQPRLRQRDGVGGLCRDLRRPAGRGISQHRIGAAIASAVCAPAFGIRAVVEQQFHARGIAGGGGFDQRRRFGVGMRVGIGIRAVIQQQLDGGSIAGTARRDHQRRSHVARNGVDVRAVLHQEAGFLEVGRGPHQRRRVGVVALVGIGALLQEPLERCGAGVEHGVHEGSRALRSARIEQLGIGG